MTGSVRMIEERHGLPGALRALRDGVTVSVPMLEKRHGFPAALRALRDGPA